MRVTATIDVYGERVAATGGNRWALAYGAWVRLFDGTELAGELPDAPERVNDLRYDAKAAGERMKRHWPDARSIDAALVDPVPAIEITEFFEKLARPGT